MTESTRRTEIMEAVERLLARGGLNAVTMRAVAAEADVSLRLVQYYGSTKDELLSATLDRLADKSVERWRARTRRQGDESPLEVIKGFYDEALPTDRASQDFHRVGVCMEGLALTGTDMAGQAYQRHLGGVEDHLSGVLESGGLSATAARRLALEVMALAHGVGTLVMTGQLSETDAQTLIKNYLERLGPQLSP
ncbi:TetR/AcrR family transcriptional regulator [Microbacterium testaceum]|jgi:AcrR family transcriptional regulator|uniref:TetR/AcrR family transcriptional regulator n=1 Tax=Microbacterium testaceum TaxID=2033 RepID=UPI000DB77888|nr:TetR family transcriptional regulator [Microbacterium testaceum]MCC4250430.1 TetR family transcriptional regulator [Microbacterium testaceum]PZT96250.1 MAG: TetR/AcrR family transcriptional regulator [Gordonia sp. (in: high G+C Gram-positive bacteria)]